MRFHLRGRRAVMALLGGIYLAGPPTDTRAQTTGGGSAEAGRATAMTICANCHLVATGQRQPPMDSVPSFDALARDPRMSEARLRGFLNRPHPPMPDPQLSRDELENLVSFILLLRRQAL